MISGWIGVDFDGTLAKYDGWSASELGEPVPLMLERVRQWLCAGIDVRIVTARVAQSGRTNAIGQIDDAAFVETQRTLIQDWTEKHLGVRLPVTASKDLAMIELWDDRAVAVEFNTGRRLN